MYDPPPDCKGKIVKAKTTTLVNPMFRGQQVGRCSPCAAAHLKTACCSQELIRLEAPCL